MSQSNNSEIREDSLKEKTISKKLYLIGLLVIFAMDYSQYVIGGFGPVLGMVIVYGVPILATGLLWGSPIIRRALTHTYTALKFGLGFFGAFTILGTLAATAIFYVIFAFDPTALNLLNRPNPVLQVSPEFAWVMVLVSLLVVGPSEEYLFRGFIYGGLLSLLKARHWFSLAVISSVLFAAAHLYYAFVYGIVSAVQFTDLFTFGIAMAATYYVSGGNLLIPAVIHGAYDATAFVGVATSTGVGALLRGFMVLIGVVVAIALFAQRTSKRSPLSP